MKSHEQTNYQMNNSSFRLNYQVWVELSLKIFLKNLISCYTLIKGT